MCDICAIYVYMYNTCADRFIYKIQNKTQNQLFYPDQKKLSFCFDFKTERRIMMYALEAKPPIKCAKFNKNNNLRDKTMEITENTIKELKQKAAQLLTVAEELKKNLTVAQAYTMNTGNETPEELKEDKIAVEEYLRRCIGSLQYIHDKRFNIQREIEKTQ